MARAKGGALASVPGRGGLQMCCVCGLALTQAEEFGSLESKPPSLPSPCLRLPVQPGRTLAALPQVSQCSEAEVPFSGESPQ